jgi:hypothetical protein
MKKGCQALDLEAWLPIGAANRRPPLLPNPSNDALLCFVGRIDAHTEKGSMLFVEPTGMCKRDVNGGLSFRIRS